jgi:hypothetical protein
MSKENRPPEPGTRYVPRLISVALFFASTS